jgi:lactobin A/cerein 7B family class IIb bacteriocin
MQTMTTTMREYDEEQFGKINGLNELSLDEIEEVSGGILCVLIIAFGAGYAVGTLIRKAL